MTANVGMIKPCGTMVTPPLFLAALSSIGFGATVSNLQLQWQDNILTISSPELPGKDLKVWYLEAYCRPGSTDRDWKETVIGHSTKLVASSADRRQLRLRCQLRDGVAVDHRIRVVDDGVDFRVTVTNPTQRPSLAHWAQPCIRVDEFTGRTQEDYLDKCFIFVDGELQRMPFEPWARRARYVPGQVWCPADVNRNDVNPRPLSTVIPSNGLIGCFSSDERMIMATAWAPYQELFQGVITCIHSDFRIGGLEPGETKHARGKIYFFEPDIEKLLDAYRRDFLTQQQNATRAHHRP